MLIVDGHEDIAWNMLTFSRDPNRSVAETRALEQDGEIPVHTGHALLGWPEWVAGRVAVVFATLFAAPIRRKVGPWERICYRDPDEARALYLASLDVYNRLIAQHGDRFQRVESCRDLAEVLATWELEPPESPRLGLVLLMEGGDAIHAPSEVEAWYAHGVRIIGPAWTGTRYAGGTHEPGPLTADGHRLLQAMAEFGLALDLSHMTEQGQRQALDVYPGVVLASHSNVQALLPESPAPERHLTDAVVRSLAERDGVIGLVLFNPFLLGGWKPEAGRALVTLDRVCAQVDHICQLTSSARHVALGSDFDGGFGLHKIPAGLDSVADLRLIGDALTARGYAAPEVEAILGGNWLSLLQRLLPET